MNPSVCIYVATHKQLNLKLPAAYRFCQVNAAQNDRWEGYLHDDDPADNISRKNCCYSELTAQYALWKREDAEIKGLAHYRRYFADAERRSPVDYAMYAYDAARMGKHVITEEQIRKALADHDLILAYPDQPFYVDAYEDLHRWVFDEDIAVMSRVIREEFPEYEEDYLRVMKRTGISYLNMLIAGREVFDSYSAWLFAVLEKVESRVDVSDYDPQHKRIFGYLSEVLLNVYVQHHGLKPYYVGVNSLQEVSGTAEKLKAAVRRLVPAKVLAERMFARTDMRARYERMMGETTRGIPADRLTLADVYEGFHTAADVQFYYEEFKELRTAREQIDLPGGDPVDAICSYYEGHDLYPYPQSNRFVIVNLFVKDPEVLQEAIDKTREQYGQRYTVNIRVMTENPARFDKQGRNLYSTFEVYCVNGKFKEN